LEQESAILASRIAVEKASIAPQRFELKPSEAKLVKIQLDPADGALTGWGQPGASATWQLPGLAPGGYEVLLRCTGAADEIVVTEGVYSLTQTCQTTADKSREQNLGTLRIHLGAGSVSVSPVRPEKCAGWRVYSIILVPSTI
jgi:hypothetical protein